MTKNRLVYYLLAIAFCLSISFSHGQSKKNSVDIIKTKSHQWNTSFNVRDTSSYFALVDSAIAVTAAGGTQVGTSRLKAITNGLFTRRPDITLDLNLQKVEVSETMNIAYDTGEWVEAWTQKNDAAKSVIKGGYWRMWKRKNDDWIIMALVLTPLSCTGSYCK